MKWFGLNVHLSAKVARLDFELLVTHRSMCSHSACVPPFPFPDNMTGMVGTALYVGPEVQGSTKSSYNQVELRH